MHHKPLLHVLDEYEKTEKYHLRHQTPDDTRDERWALRREIEKQKKERENTK